MNAPTTHPPVPLKPWQAHRRRLVAWDRRLDDLADEARRAVGEVLESAGYHRHDRGEWRLKRRKDDDMAEDLKLSRPDRGMTVELLMASAERASRSPDAAHAYFGKCNAMNPRFEVLLISIHGGNLASEAEKSLLDRLGKRDHLRREAAKRHVEQLRRDLLGPDEPSAIERVVVDRAVVCYLALQLAEVELAAWDDRRPRTYVEKRVDHAQRRLMDVLKALDHLRKKVPAAHLTRIQVLGDLTIHPAPAKPTPAAIDVTPVPEVTQPQPVPGPPT